MEQPGIKACSEGGILTGCLQKVISAFFLLCLMQSGLYAESRTEAASGAATSMNAAVQAGSGKPDFLFESPKGFIGFRIGRFFPRADSDLFDMVTDQLTLEKSDFNAWEIDFDGGPALNERVDLIFSLGYMRRTLDSEFRDYVDDRDLPITQTTRFEQVPITAGIRFLLMPRGRQVGSYSYIPSRVVPFVGAGGGVLWYRFEQTGDFVDFDTLEIFPAKLRSQGWTPTLYAGGGADINLAKSLYFTMDLRYSWADARLQRDYVGFDPIDLSGFRVTAGLHWHF